MGTPTRAPSMGRMAVKRAAATPAATYQRGRISPRAQAAATRTATKAQRAAGSSLIRVLPTSTAGGAIAQARLATEPATKAAHQPRSAWSRLRLDLYDKKPDVRPRRRARRRPKAPVTRHNSAGGIPKRVRIARMRGQPGE